MACADRYRVLSVVRFDGARLPAFYGALQLCRFSLKLLLLALELGLASPHSLQCRAHRLRFLGIQCREECFELRSLCLGQYPLRFAKTERVQTELSVLVPHRLA